MDLDLKTISQTTNNKLAGVVRIMLGGMFMMTGFMKLLVPSLGIAFAGQLQAANIPFPEFNIWFVPCAEILLGAILTAGMISRLAALAGISLMTVALYVHLVVDDPTLFPLQPELPIIPIMVIVMSVYLIIEGGGSWSIDLKQTNRSADQ